MQREDISNIGSWIGFMSNKVKTMGGINLAQGLPGFSPPQVLLSLLAEEATGSNHQYAPGRGVPALLNQVVRYLRLPPAAASTNVLITCGATEAITLIYQHLARKKGNSFTVAAFGPAYESYSSLPALLGHRFIELAWEPDGQMDFDRLKTILVHQHVDLLIAGSPGNPWGRVLSANEMGQLCKLASTSDVRIIFDMVYSELWFDKPVSFPWPLIQKNIYVVGSFSKLFSVTGWRVGWLAADADEMTGISRLHDFTSLSAPHPLQVALSRFMDDEQEMGRYINQLRSSIKESVALLEQELSRLGFEVMPAGGGYFVWAELPEWFPDSGSFALDLYEFEGVATVPGIHFGASFHRFVRFNGARPAAEIAEAVTRITRFLLARKLNRDLI